MPDPILILVNQETGGVAATHPVRYELPNLVAPSTEDELTNVNTLRQPLVTIGCLMLPNEGFAFDSSLLAPETKDDFKNFATIMETLAQGDKDPAKRLPPISIWGHADPVGGDAFYNKILSGRRARSAYAVLTRTIKMWEELDDSHFGGDVWGDKARQMMLSVLIDQQSSPPQPYFQGVIDGKPSPEYTRAVKAFQRDKNSEKADDEKPLPETGVVDRKTRKKLFSDYMDFLCQDANGQRFVLDPEQHFLGRKKDKDLKADMQGCSELNLRLLMSEEEDKEFKKDPKRKDERNAINAPNRRVVIYIFKHDTVIDTKKWPCPTVLHPNTIPCHNRFWSDAKERTQKDPTTRREFKNIGKPRETGEREKGTFPCRFYHAFARHSPCEDALELWKIRLRVDGGKEDPDPLAGRRYVVIAGEDDFSPVFRGSTDDDGQLIVPVLDEVTKMKLKVDAWTALFSDTPELSGPEGTDTDKFSDEDKFVLLPLDGGALVQLNGDDLAAKQRLYNLGFGTGDPAKWDNPTFQNALRQFQKFHNIQGEEGTVGDATKAKLKSEHGS